MMCTDTFYVCLLSNTKDTSNAQKLSRGGIPLANGDALLPKPPPWAYPLSTAQEVYRNSNDRTSRSTSQAIDQAMAHLWEAKVKFVKVNLAVEKRSPASVSLEAVSSCCHMSRPDGPNDLEWVRVVLTAEPGVSMDDIEDQQPSRRKEHRRVPSTIAMEEVKVSFLKW